jgi:transcriptional repressor NrdR
VSSTHIGELVMEGLKDVDEVAYVRYASVHRQFKDINTLLNEIEELVKLKDTLERYENKKK